MVYAMEVHDSDSVKAYYEEHHAGDLPLPFGTSCSYSTVVSDTYSDAYNCLTYTDEDVLSSDQQRSNLLIQQPRVDLVSGSTDDLANSLINSHRDYRLAVLSTVTPSVQNLDAQCNIVDGLTNYSTRNNPTTASVVVSTPTDAWQIHSGSNTPVVTSGHASVGPVPGVNIGTAIGQAGTILGVGIGTGNGVGANGSTRVNGNGHHHHHHHHQPQHIGGSGGGSSHSRGSSSSSTSGSATKPKRRRVQTTAQRKAANVRERRRMFHLNEAFDELRKRLPAFNYEKRLSRIETLRLAMTYIGFMKEVTTGKDPGDIELQKYKKLGSITDGDDDDDDDEDDDDDDDENSLEDKHRKTHKRQRKFGFYSKDKHELKDFESL